MTPEEREILISIRRGLVALAYGLWALVFTIIVCFGICVASAQGSDIGAALKDRAKFAERDWGYLFYVTYHSVPDQYVEDLRGVTSFVTASCSQQQIIERCTPTYLTSRMARIDIRDMQWNPDQWRTVLKGYPYAPYTPLPMIVRADWLVQLLSDTSRSDARYRLLYGTTKFNRDDFLKLWQAGSKVEHHFGFIEGQSGVAVVKKRWVENRPNALRTYVWGTLDFSKVSDATDPLAHPDRTFKHEAEEWIAGMPKMSLTTYERGNLQDYLLSNAQGVRAEEAPTSIADDKNKFRGLPSVRTWGSCVGCHPLGINGPKINEFQRYLNDSKSQATVYKRKLKEQIELFHLGGTEAEIERNRTGYAMGIKLCNGWTPEVNATKFTQVIAAYDAPVTMEQAARELYAEPEELKNALAYYSTKGYQLNARMSELVDGVGIPRTSWEESSGYSTAYYALQYWRKSLERVK